MKNPSFPIAKINEIGYPHLSLTNPETLESYYIGRDVGEYFKKYDSKFYMDYQITMWNSSGSWQELGKVSNYVELGNGKFPKIKVELVLE